MAALVVLYMVDQLLLPGHVDHIAGYGVFRAAIVSVVGPLSPQALASQIYGLYAGFVYFTPVLGGLIADRWLGQRNAVVVGALLMSAGHIAMAFDQSFLIALALLVIGSGFLKGNISAQVGALYPMDDESRRARGFIIFSTAINAGAVCGPILCGVLAQVYGWHYGFGAAGVFMLAGLATYLYGYRYLPARVPRQAHEGGDLTAADWRVIGSLLCVMLISIFQSVAYLQIGNVLMVWVQQHVALEVGPFSVPVPWFVSIDALASIAGVPLLFWLWRWQRSRGKEPSELAKFGVGAGIAGRVGAGAAFTTRMRSGVEVPLTGTGLLVSLMYSRRLSERICANSVNRALGAMTLDGAVTENRNGWPPLAGNSCCPSTVAGAPTRDTSRN